jgi:hypothetical protein
MARVWVVRRAERPALADQIASLPSDHEPLAHDAILIASTGGGNALRATRSRSATDGRLEGPTPNRQHRCWTAAGLRRPARARPAQYASALSYLHLLTPTA